MEDNNLKTIVDAAVKEALQAYGVAQFTSRKLGDTPTDANQLVPRKWVTLNGTTANRPKGSILGQYYFDTSLGYPVYWNGVTFVKYDGTAA